MKNYTQHLSLATVLILTLSVFIWADLKPTLTTGGGSSTASTMEPTVLEDAQSNTVNLDDVQQQGGSIDNYESNTININDIPTNSVNIDDVPSNSVNLDTL